MGIGAAIFLIAVGAILKFAVDVTVQGVDLKIVGVDEYGRPIRRDRDVY